MGAKGKNILETVEEWANATTYQIANSATAMVHRTLRYPHIHDDYSEVVHTDVLLLTRWIESGDMTPEAVARAKRTIAAIKAGKRRAPNDVIEWPKKPEPEPEPQPEPKRYAIPAALLNWRALP